MDNNAHAHAHRSACLKLVLCLLAVWFTVSFGCGILFREALDKFSIGNAPFGFWMAQQGSIICFVILLFIYAFMMNKIDHKYGFEDTPESAKNTNEEGQN